MLKFWTSAFIGITIFANVAICDDDNYSFEEAAVDLVKDLPKYLKDAIHEIEYENSANSINAAKRIRFPRPSQCFKDYLRLHTALLRQKDRSWALSGIVLNEITPIFMTNRQTSARNYIMKKIEKSNVSSHRFEFEWKLRSQVN